MGYLWVERWCFFVIFIKVLCVLDDFEVFRNKVYNYLNCVFIVFFWLVFGFVFVYGGVYSNRVE